MPWYFHAARKQIFPSGRIISFFALVSIIGVSLGVAVLLIVQSVMNGFVNDIRSSLANTNGDIRIFGDGLIEEWKQTVSDIEERPEVEAVTPFSQGVVMVQAANVPIFPFVWGLDLERGPQVLPVDEFMVVGSLEELDDRSVIVSTGVARQLGVHLGSHIDIYTPLMLDRMKNDEVLMPINMRVGGVFESGWNEVDANTIIVTLRTMQELYGLGDRVHGLSIKLIPGADATEAAASLARDLPDPLFPRTWLEMNADFLFILQLEKTVLFFIMIFIVLVASFSIAISLMMAVIRKTREIGLLSAMGATRGSIAACFCLQGFLIGLVGTSVGVGGALLALHFRSEIIEWFTQITGRGDALVDAYGFAYLPVHYIPSDFVIVIVFSIVVSTLAGLIPAWRAARLQPAEALRGE